MKKLKTIFLAGLMFLVVTLAMNQTNVCNATEAPMEFPGQIENTGTFFEIEDSEYLNLTLESSEEVRIFFESIPKMISMDIDSVDDNIDFTDLILTGLESNKTYYKYENSYRNLVVFNSGINGTYSWTQEINEPHHVWIQETKSTIFLPADCETYGTWDSSTSTCTLTQDLTESVEIEEGGITLDCAGHSIVGTGADIGYGTYVYNKDNVTIKNCTVTDFYIGILFRHSDSGEILNSNTRDNHYGIYLSTHSNNSVIKDNTNSNNYTGITLHNASNNNEIKNNVVSFNDYIGIHLQGNQTVGWACKDNLIVENDILNNSSGIYVVHSVDNKIYHNNFIGNPWSASTYNEYTDDDFDNGYPDGGNYWDDYFGSDLYNGPEQDLLGSDGIGDVPHTPYALSDVVEDRYPFMVENGWETVEPNPDISITSTPLQFYNDESPFLPNVLKVRAMVKNEGNVRVDDVIVRFTLDGELIGEKSISFNKVGLVEITWEPTFSVENKILRVEAIIVNGVDFDLSNNVIEQPVSFYWIDFRYDEDAFSFSNEDWEYDYRDELETVFESNGITGKARAALGGFILAYTQSKDGHCYGMAAASTHWYIASEDKPRQIDTFKMHLEQEDVKADIINHHWSQIFYRVRFWKDTIINYKPQEHYNAILQDIKNGLPAVVSLGESWSLSSGHAVTAYSVLDLGNEKRVHVYDNEEPLKKMIKVEYHNSAIFKVSSNEANYKGFDRVVHVPKEYSLFPSSLDFTDLTKISIKQLWNDGMMYFSEHSPADPLVTDEHGRRTGYVGDTFYNEIPRAEVKKVDGTYLFYLPLEFTYSIEMIGTSTGNVGVDFVIPISESQAEVAIYKGMPVTLGSQISATVNPTALTYQIISETGEVITPDDEGKLDADFVSSAKWLKEKATGNLEEAKTGNSRIDKKINRVIKDINKSLQDDLWQDEIYLDPKKGRKVFGCEMAAVTKMKLYLYLSNHSNYHKLPDNVVIAFEEAIKDLIEADEILAQAILNEAKNTPVKNPRYQARFDRMIVKAEQNLEQAQEYSANKPARAIFRYGSCWYYSQKAIKYANKN